MGDRIGAGWEWHPSARCWNVKQNSKRLPSLTGQYCLSGLSLPSATIVSTVSIWQTDKNFFPQVKLERWRGLAAHEQDTQSLTVQMEEAHTKGLTTFLIIGKEIIFSSKETCTLNHVHPWAHLSDVSWPQIWRVFTVFVNTFTTERQYSSNRTILTCLHSLTCRDFSTA